MTGTGGRRTGGQRIRGGACVVVVGAINVDFVVSAQQLPGPGETVVGRRLERHGGGKGANAAVAGARAGAQVALVGAAGDDDLGQGALAELADAGVDVTGVARVEGEATGVALIAVDAAGENQIAVGAGANAAVTPEAVRAALAERLRPGMCVLVSTEIAGAAVVAAVAEATARGVTCLLNPAPPISEVLEVLEHGPILTPNAGELERVAGALSECSGSRERGPAHAAAAGPAQAAAALVERTHAPVVVTLGGEGAVVVGAGGEPVRLAAPAAAVRDTTGAGDTFNGVLAARLAAGDEIIAAARAAVVAASLSVGEVGARTGMPSRERIEEQLREIRGGG